MEPWSAFIRNKYKIHDNRSYAFSDSEDKVFNAHDNFLYEGILRMYDNSSVVSQHIIENLESGKYLCLLQTTVSKLTEYLELIVSMGWITIPMMLPERSEIETGNAFCTVSSREHDTVIVDLLVMPL